MMHLDDGQLLALRDDPHLVDDERRAHLGSCPTCVQALEASRRRGDDVAHALGALDHGSWNLHAARERVRLRVSQAAAREAGAVSLPARRARTAAWTLSRAAGLVLLAAGGAAALPGSPLRTWIHERFTREAAPPAPAAVEAATAAPAVEAEAEEVGVRLPVTAGPLTVVLRGAAEGTEVRVRWIPGREAAVLAPVGSRFTSGEGRVDATLAPGVVRVELPEGVSPVLLEADGRTLLRVTDSGVEVTGPVLSRSAGGITFRIPRP